MLLKYSPTTLESKKLLLAPTKELSLLLALPLWLEFDSLDFLSLIVFTYPALSPLLLVLFTLEDRFKEDYLFLVLSSPFLP